MKILPAVPSLLALGASFIACPACATVSLGAANAIAVPAPSPTLASAFRPGSNQIQVTLDGAVVGGFGFPASSASAAPTTFAAPVALAVSAVPEPAAWAMMLGGFALAGAALRKTRARGRRALA